MADRHLKYDHWKLLYQEVLVAHRPQELRRKIQSAEAAIYQRLQAMAHNASDQSERQVIADAVFTLRILQRGKTHLPVVSSCRRGGASEALLSS